MSVTKSLIWQNRLVKMLDNCNWAMSRVGDWCDWDYFPLSPDREMAVAGNYEGITVIDFEIVDENCLRFKTATGAYLLHGNPAGEYARIEWEPRQNVDLSKLTPAPWTHDGHCRIEGPDDENGNGTMTIYDEGGHSPTDADFIVLARNAFDVMMRRGWSAAWEDGGGDPRFKGWCAIDKDGHFIDMSATPGTKEFPIRADPFTALVEADKWMAAKEKA